MVKLFGSIKSSRRLESLHAVTLFAKLKQRELRIVDGLLHERDFLPDEVIFDKGEEGQALYVVFSGEVAIAHPDEDSDVVVARLGPGAFFGDMALIDTWPRSAQARAATPTSLGVLFREDFLTLMETHARIASKIALQLAREMGQRLRQQLAGVPVGREKL